MKTGKCFLRAVGLSLILSMVVLTAALGAEIIASFSLDSLDGVISRNGVSLDKAVTKDGKGSLRIETSGPATIRLFEVNHLNVENARLIYRAKLRSENLKGQAYLEMWLRFPGSGEYFSRGLQNAITGNSEWASVQTPFVLLKGQNPDLAKLNLVIIGPGVVWIDDIVLEKGPLH